MKHSGQVSASRSLRNHVGKYIAIFIVAFLPLAFLAWAGATSGNSDETPAATEASNQTNEDTKGVDSTGNNSSVTVETNSSTSSSAQSSQNVSVNSSGGSSASDSSTSVKINGKHVHVPKDGELHKYYTDENGNSTQIDISSNSDGSSSDSTSSVNVQINSESTDTQ